MSTTAPHLSSASRNELLCCPSGRSKFVCGGLHSAANETTSVEIMGGKLTPKPTNHHNANDLQTFGGIGSGRSRAPVSTGIWPQPTIRIWRLLLDANRHESRNLH